MPTASGGCAVCLGTWLLQKGVLGPAHHRAELTSSLHSQKSHCFSEEGGLDAVMVKVSVTLNSYEVQCPFVFFLLKLFPRYHVASFLTA